MFKITNSNSYYMDNTDDRFEQKRQEFPETLKNDMEIDETSQPAPEPYEIVHTTPHHYTNTIPMTGKRSQFYRNNGLFEDDPNKKQCASNASQLEMIDISAVQTSAEAEAGIAQRMIEHVKHNNLMELEAVLQMGPWANSAAVCHVTGEKKRAYSFACESNNRWAMDLFLRYGAVP